MAIIIVKRKLNPIPPVAVRPAPPAILPPKPEPVLPKTCDGECRAAINLTEASIIPWFLMASYLYYIHDRSLLSDGLYDQMAREILENFDNIDHRHKDLIRKYDLTTGSLHRMKASEYPLRTRGAACRLAFLTWGEKLLDSKDDDFYDDQASEEAS